jgi:hypothetical protein
MTFQVIAEGPYSDTTALAEAESRLKEGDQVELRIYTNSTPTAQQLADIQTDILNAGFLLQGNVTYDSGIIVIRYLKSTQPASPGIGQFEIPFMATAIIGLVATIGVGIFAWQMAKNVGKALTNPLLIIGVIAVIVGYFMIKKNHPDERPQEDYE